jgi:hypothetical protein
MLLYFIVATGWMNETNDYIIMNKYTYYKEAIYILYNMSIN